MVCHQFKQKLMWKSNIAENIFHRFWFCLYICIYIYLHTRAREYMYAHITMRNAF